MLIMLVSCMNDEFEEDRFSEHVAHLLSKSEKLAKQYRVNLHLNPEKPEYYCDLTDEELEKQYQDFAEGRLFLVEEVSKNKMGIRRKIQLEETTSDKVISETTYNIYVKSVPPNPNLLVGQISFGIKLLQGEIVGWNTFETLFRWDVVEDDDRGWKYTIYSHDTPPLEYAGRRFTFTAIADINAGKVTWRHAYQQKGIVVTP